MATRKIKIGYTKCLNDRFYIYSRQFVIDCKCCALKEVPNDIRAIDFERQMHTILKHKRIFGEWFDLNDAEISNFVKENGFAFIDPKSITILPLKKCEHIGECICLNGENPPKRIDASKCPKTRLSGTLGQSCWKVK